MVIASSIVAILLNFIKQGLTSYEGQKLIYYIHNLVGFAVLSLLAVQFISGVAAKKVEEYTNIKTKTLIIVKSIHKFSGIIIILCAKYHYISQLVLRNSPLLWLFIPW